MVYRWWEYLKDLLKNEDHCSLCLGSEEVRKKLSIDFEGSLSIGENSVISKDARLSGNILIGNNCMIGTGAVLRGNVRIYDNVRIGYGAEIKNSVIKENTSIGPLCYLGDSLVERNVYLGALVRTSNHRLDRAVVKSWNGERYEDTGMEKLGAWIKENANLGVGVVIYPGRIVPQNSTFSPHIVITKNYGSGIYKMEQIINHTPIAAPVDI